MGDIHVLKTSSSSKIGRFIDTQKITLRSSTDIPRGENVNIYITSDEEIKEGVGQWYLDKFLNKPRNSSGSQYGENQNVIILTTDQDLIKDGVQGIDDEFLDWFVNNPSCEEVEVENSSVVKEHIFDGSNDGEVIWEYKIVIPKEEPKTNLEKHLESLPDSQFIRRSAVVTQQETLEEFINSQPYYGSCTHEYKEGIELGAKWQQERMYSEEEVEFIIKIFNSYWFENNPEHEDNLKDWELSKKLFEQFKKK